MKINEYLTVMQAAELFGVAPNTLRNWDKKGIIKVIRNPQNDYRLYIKEEIEALLNDISFGERKWKRKKKN